jgi:hypothetical protein
MGPCSQGVASAFGSMKRTLHTWLVISRKHSHICKLSSGYPLLYSEPSLAMYQKASTIYSTPISIILHFTTNTSYAYTIRPFFHLDSQRIVRRPLPWGTTRPRTHDRPCTSPRTCQPQGIASSPSARTRRSRDIFDRVSVFADSVAPGAGCVCDAFTRSVIDNVVESDLMYLEPAPFPAPATPFPAAVTMAPAKFPIPDAAAPVVRAIQPCCWGGFGAEYGCGFAFGSGLVWGLGTVVGIFFATVVGVFFATVVGGFFATACGRALGCCFGGILAVI